MLRLALTALYLGKCDGALRPSTPRMVGGTQFYLLRHHPFPKHSLSTDMEPGSVLTALHKSPRWSLPTLHGLVTVSFLLRDEEKKAQRSQVTCPRSQSQSQTRLPDLASEF